MVVLPAISGLSEERSTDSLLKKFHSGSIQVALTLEKSLNEGAMMWNLSRPIYTLDEQLISSRKKKRWRVGRVQITSLLKSSIFMNSSGSE